LPTHDPNFTKLDPASYDCRDYPNAYAKKEGVGPAKTVKKCLGKAREILVDAENPPSAIVSGIGLDHIEII